MKNSNITAATGAEAPDFTLKSDHGTDWRLNDHIGNVLVLLFYPQNETLICTRQLCSVRDNWEKYLETKSTIVGISPGTQASHNSFSQSRHLPIPLLADPDRSITRMYCKHWLYPVNFTRSVVIIDAHGVIRNRNIMLRAFRPSDAKLITDIYAARSDAFNEEYDRLKHRVERVS